MDNLNGARSGAGGGGCNGGTTTRYPSSSRRSISPSSSTFADLDISKMSDAPPRSRVVGHRRAHSEILSLPDDISFESDLGVVGGGGGGHGGGNGGGASLSDEAEEDFFSMYIDMEKFGSGAGAGNGNGNGNGNGLGVVAAPGTSSSMQLQQMGSYDQGESSSRQRIRHQHSQSMDGSSSMRSDLLVSGSEGGGPSFAENRKAISSSKLADLALVDPKRAKRIWANRQSAARSKERKMRYISELERKVQTLQSEATTLSAQLALLQNDTGGMASENSELKLRLHTMEQQVHLQDALNDALRDEVQRLKVMTGQLMTGQAMTGAGSMRNLGLTHGLSQPVYPNNQAMQTFLAAQQLQQLQIQSQQSQQLQHQRQQQQQFNQQTGDLILNGSFPSQHQIETSSDNIPSASNSRDQGSGI